MASNMSKMYKLLKDANPNFLIMVKIGSFYHVYGKDAYMLSYLQGYQLKTVDDSLNTCGFPVSTIGKIENELTEKEINYLKISKKDNYDVEDEVSFKGKNRYNEYSERAYKFVMKRKRVDAVASYLLDMPSDDEFNEKIQKIESFMYGGN